MHPPILRFPGGTDVDYIDWLDLVDNVPGRGAERPETTTGHSGRTITNRFGYDEFLRLCADLHSEPLLVVNFRDGVLRKKPLADAARHAAELVAYCNAQAGASLPAEMPDWAAVRAQNGHAEPYRVPYFQIGNETWFFWQEIEQLGMTHAEALEWYLDCLEDYVTAMRAVDSNIAIIVDGTPAEELLPALHARLGDQVQFVVEHIYFPGPYRDVRRHGQPYPPEQLTTEEIWNAWVAGPQVDAQGQSCRESSIYEYAKTLGYQVAVTEWNWNGWPGRRNADTPPLALESGLARGLGAAGMLHALLRHGDVLALAAQSMCVGVGWKLLASIYLDPAGDKPAVYNPAGQAVMFYNHYHGHDCLAVSAEDVPTYIQPYGLGWRPDGLAHPVAYLDYLATASSDAVYLHLINRAFAQDLPVTIDLSAFSVVGAHGVMHGYTGRLHDDPAPGEADEIVTFTDTPVTLTGKLLSVTLPRRSIASIEIPLRR